MMRASMTVLAAMLIIGNATALRAGDAEDCANAEALLKTDPAKAVVACGRLAEQGYAYAQYNLGAMYEQGQGVPQDYKEALNLFRRAADQGFAAAQSNIGLAYANGQGVSQDYKEAVKWYRKAADQGYAAGQFQPRRHVRPFPGRGAGLLASACLVRARGNRLSPRTGPR